MTGVASGKKCRRVGKTENAENVSEKTLHGQRTSLLRMQELYLKNTCSKGFNTAQLSRASYLF